MNLFDASDEGAPLPGAEIPIAANGASRGRPRLPDAVRACLQRGGLVVTGNARAARALNLAYAEIQRRNGLEAWLTPPIRDWAGWMGELWDEALLVDEDAPLLLSSLQEHALWKSIARQHGDAGLVVSADGIADLAQSAYALLSAYEAHPQRRRSWDYNGSVDAEAFRKWANTFDERCQKRGWVSRSLIEQQVAAAVGTDKVNVPSEILLTGFDKVLPAQQSVLAALKARGVSVSFLATEVLESGAGQMLVEAKDRRDEIAACAWWLRQRLIERADVRIAVIAQDANGTRGEIERIFRRVLLPASISIAAPAADVPYEFSLGTPLAAVPVARAALLLLRWLDEPLLQEEVSWLLLSGFLAERRGQLLPLAQLDARMRQSEHTPPEIKLDWWLRHSFGDRSEAGIELRRRLGDVQRVAAAGGIGDTATPRNRDRNSEKIYSSWIAIAHQVLTAAGWPGAESEDSAGFQARKRWETMMDSVAALAFDGGRVAYREFIKVVGHTAGQTIFAPQSRNAPIQIMGPLESAGQEFDAVWFLRASDLEWPSAGSPHPLIPIALQREAGMPHASAEADWQLGRRVTIRIATSAPVCVFSYPKQSADGEARPSPVLGEVFPSSAVPAAALRETLGCGPEPLRQSQAVEIVEEASVHWPVEVTAGGSDLLRMQAACPFQAFATRRLGAREIKDAERGLTAVDRGKILHEVLEKVWSKENEPQLRLQTRDDLVHALSEGRLAAIVDHHVSSALSRWADPADEWTTAYLASERRRLCGLLDGWLAKESQRQPFEVEACERRLDDVHVGELRLKLRIDRIDRLPSGARLLLDYKSGAVSSSDWDEERPDEPQLPLYAAFGDVENLQGLLFAKLRANRMELNGRVTHLDDLLDPSLLAKGKAVTAKYSEAMRGEWAAALQALADEFVHGRAAVKPKNYPDTCTYCQLPSLCRVAETMVPVIASTVDPEIFETADAGDRSQS